MKYIITEDRLQNVFRRFVNDILGGITYNPTTREFVFNDGEVFGYVLSRNDLRHFFYGDYNIENFFDQAFGDKTNGLLLKFLNDNFPELNIKTIDSLEEPI